MKTFSKSRRKSRAPIARKAESHIRRRKTACSACGEERLVRLLDLPNLPLTGIYLKEKVRGRFEPSDQGLSLCRVCGHAQLLNVLDPNYVYDDTYTHRSSQSPIATGGNDFFHVFIAKLSGGRKFRRIVDVGCNDMVLLRKLQPMGERLLGVDPIWRGNEPPDEGNIRVLGKFIEEVDLAKELGGRPDLVVSTHTFEHIDEPKVEIKRLLDAADPDALFVVEVPSFDTLLELSRFDQVFHQHIQYFSLASFSRMVRDLGCRVTAHAFNYYYWGGTMLVAFRRARGGSGEDGFQMPTEEAASGSFSRFKAQLTSTMKTVESLRGTAIHGFGAAQMLPTLAYHMGTDLSFLDSILDDDPRRDGLVYPDLAPRIERPGEDFTLEGKNVLLTALDSARPILRRLIALRPKRLLLPLSLL